MQQFNTLWLVVLLSYEDTKSLGNLVRGKDPWS